MVKDFIKTMLFHEPEYNIGEVHIEWHFPEFVKYNRGKWWYIIVAVVIIVLLVYSIVTINFLFAIIILMFTFIGIFQYYQQPHKIPVKITDAGVLIGRRFYTFKELASFWFVYEPPMVKNLYLDFQSGKRSLMIPLGDINPLKVRELLEQTLQENLDKETEHFDEAVARLLKLH